MKRSVTTFFIAYVLCTTLAFSQIKKIYWSDGSVPAIMRSNPDGSELEVVVVNDLINPYEVFVDQRNFKLYWSDRGTKTIERSNLDGSDREVVIGSFLNEPRGLAIDPISEKLFWVDFGTQKIQKANLSDGSEIETIIEGIIEEPWNCH